MVSRFTKKLLLLVFVLAWLATAVTIGILSLRSYIKNHPDQALEWSAHIEQKLQEMTLPIRIAQLSTQAADEVLLMPVYGVDTATIEDTWAALRAGGRSHEGQDIFAEKGTPIFSATAGYITRIRESELGGNTVSVVGAGGRFYYYAHLDRYAEGIEVGDEVTVDTILGYVGNTGNAATTPSHLHFGMYQRGQGAANPLPLLKDRITSD